MRRPSTEDEGRRWRLVRAGTDAIPLSLRRLMERATRGRSVAIPGTVPWRLISLICAAVALLVWVVFASPVLAVRNVQVNGLVWLEEFRVQEAAAVVRGTPLSRLDTSVVTGRVAALAPVASVEVTRVWPATVRIDIIERVPVGAVKRDNQFHLFDDQGVIFRAADSLPAEVVLVDIKIGEPDRLIKASLQVIRSLTPELRSELVSISIDGPAGIALALRKDRMVTWGDAVESDLKAKVATALLARKEKKIDVSVPEIITIE